MNFSPKNYKNHNQIYENFKTPKKMNEKKKLQIHSSWITYKYMEIEGEPNICRMDSRQIKHLFLLDFQQKKKKKKNRKKQEKCSIDNGVYTGKQSDRQLDRQPERQTEIK